MPLNTTGIKETSSRGKRHSQPLFFPSFPTANHSRMNTVALPLVRTNRYIALCPSHFFIFIPPKFACLTLAMAAPHGQPAAPLHPEFRAHDRGVYVIVLVLPDLISQEIHEVLLDQTCQSGRYQMEPFVEYMPRDEWCIHLQTVGSHVNHENLHAAMLLLPERGPIQNCRLSGFKATPTQNFVQYVYANIDGDSIGIADRLREVNFDICNALAEGGIAHTYAPKKTMMVRVAEAKRPGTNPSVKRFLRNHGANGGQREFNISEVEVWTRREDQNDEEVYHFFASYNL